MSRRNIKPSLGELIGGCFHQHPRYQGCVAHWLMNEGGGSTLYDISKRVNNLTFGATTASPTWVNGARGIALQFDGGDHAIAAVDFLNGPAQLTVSAWVKPTTLGTSVARAILAQEDYSGGYVNTSFSLYYQGFVSPEKWSFGVSNNGTTFYDAFANTLPTLNQWVHLVGVYDGETALIYQNGKSDGQNTSPTGALFNSTLTPLLGAERALGSIADWFDGLIDDVRIYTRALTPGEVLSLYQDPFLEFEQDDDRWFIDAGDLTFTGTSTWQNLADAPSASMSIAALMVDDLNA